MMAGKSRDIHEKRANCRTSGLLKRLEREQAELLKTFDRHLDDVKSLLAQNKTMSAERAYRYFFEISDDLVQNKQQQRHLLKLIFLEVFDAETELKLGERKKALNWLVE